jgi:hypothetical protein
MMHGLPANAFCNARRNLGRSCVNLGRCSNSTLRTLHPSLHHKEVKALASSKGSPGPHDRKPGSVRPQCIKITVLGKRCKRIAGKGGKLCNFHQEQARIELDAGNQMLKRKGKLPPAPSEERTAKRSELRSRLNRDPAHRAPDPSPIHGSINGIRTGLKREAKRKAAALGRATKSTVSKSRGSLISSPSLSKFVITEQSKDALRRLGIPFDPDAADLSTVDSLTTTSTTRLRRLDPKLILLDTVNSAWRQRQVWESMLSAIPEADWTDVGRMPVPGRAETSKGARIEIIQKNLSEATKIAARVSKLAIDAGIEERLVKIAEEQSAIIADTVRAAIVAGVAAIVMQLRLGREEGDLATREALDAASGYLRRLATGEQPNPDLVVAGYAERIP